MIVVKLGGGSGLGFGPFCDDIASMCSKDREQFIVVHGGSAKLNQLATDLNCPPKFITSPQGITSRWTDSEAMELFLMAYCGWANKNLIQQLQQRHVHAVGLSGMDGRLWVGPRKDVTQVVENGVRRILRGNLTGRVDHVNTELLHDLLGKGYVPVLTPPALSDDGLAINVDGDRAAARTAIEMGAETLLILTNQPGVLRDLTNPASVVANITLNENIATDLDFVQGRMRIKLMAAGEALRGGVGRVIISDGRKPGCIRNALAGNGTVTQLS